MSPRDPIEPVAPPMPGGGHDHDHDGHGHDHAPSADADRRLLAIALALVAARLALRPVTSTFTFGLRRAEVLSAQINGIGLVVLAAVLGVESVRRLLDPSGVEGAIVIVATLTSAPQTPTSGRSRAASPPWPPTCSSPRATTATGAAASSRRCCASASGSSTRRSRSTTSAPRRPGS